MNLDPASPNVIIPAAIAAGRLAFDWWKWRVERHDRKAQQGGGKDEPPSDAPSLAA